MRLRLGGVAGVGLYALLTPLSVSAQAASPAGTAPGSEAAATLETRAAAIERAAVLLETRFTYPDVGRRYASMLRVKQKAGAYRALGDTELSAKLTADLQSVAADRHLKVFAEGAGPGGREPGGTGPKRERPPPITDAKWLEPGIAYIGFCGHCQTNGNAWILVDA